MTSRSLSLTLAALGLSGALAFAQPPQPAPADPGTTQPAAPIERAAPPAPPRGGMMQHGPGGPMSMHGGPGGAMSMHHGGEGMDGGFHIVPGGMWWKNPRVVSTLALTPEQVKKMDGIFQESRLKLIDLHANVQKQEVMLEPLLSANPLDAPKAQAQIDRVADARAELEKTNARMLLNLRGILTPDQWTKLQDGHHGGPDPQGGPQATPASGGRGRGLRGGGPPPSPTSNNLVEEPGENQ